MRLVVDTGVFISAAIKAQTVPNLAVHRAVHRGVLLKSHATEAELMDVIDRPNLARLNRAGGAGTPGGVDGIGRTCAGYGSALWRAVTRRTTNFSTWW